MLFYETILYNYQVEKFKNFQYNKFSIQIFQIHLDNTNKTKYNIENQVQLVTLNKYYAKNKPQGR